MNPLVFYNPRAERLELVRCSEDLSEPNLQLYLELGDIASFINSFQFEVESGIGSCDLLEDLVDYQLENIYLGVL